MVQRKSMYCSWRLGHVNVENNEYEWNDVFQTCLHVERLIDQRNVMMIDAVVDGLTMVYDRMVDWKNCSN